MAPMRTALVHVTSIRCPHGHQDKTKTSCNASRTLHQSGAKSSCSAPNWGFVCVCTVLGHERRGSLPSTCYCNFTCQVTCQFSAGGSGPLKSPLPTKLLLSWEDIQADHLDVPAKTTPVWQIRKTAPVREIRRPTSHNSFQSNMNMSVGMSGFAINACV